MSVSDFQVICQPHGDTSLKSRRLPKLFCIVVGELRLSVGNASIHFGDVVVEIVHGINENFNLLVVLDEESGDNSHEDSSCCLAPLISLSDLMAIQTMSWKKFHLMQSERVKRIHPLQTMNVCLNFVVAVLAIIVEL